ncbi:hypothetical protein [Roseobacter fucihabitans]|uniref:hypothetical protein n=1 Tax=Roseobacter fucihabitans TaxID=1537242 RepID=UPI001CA33B3C|nr:hypothetical protein [Roseobacter litoralis]
MADAIDRYVQESNKQIGRTKTQVLKSIKTFDIADKVVPAICPMAGPGDNALKNQTLGVFMTAAMLKPITVPILPPHHSHIFISDAKNTASSV